MALYNKVEAGKRLTEIIVESDLNSNQFAKSIGCDPSYLSKMESGKVGISSKYVKAIEQNYGVNKEWLLFGNGQKRGQNVPHGTLQQAPESKQENADTPLHDLILSNSKLADAALINAEANKLREEKELRLVQSNAELTAMLRESAANAAGSPLSDPAILVKVQEVLAKIASGKKYDSLEEARAAIGILLGLHVGDNKKKESIQTGARKSSTV